MPVSLGADVEIILPVHSESSHLSLFFREEKKKILIDQINCPE